MKSVSQKSFLPLLLVAVSANCQALEPYLFGLLGQSDWDVTGFDSSDSYLALGIGFEITPYMAIELGYNDFGKVNANTGGGSSLDIQAVTVDVVAKFPVNASFDGYAKIGFDVWDASPMPAAVLVDDSGTDVMAVIGAGFYASQAATINLEYQLHSFNEVDINALALGFNLRF
jgi:hypothetical protein